MVWGSFVDYMPVLFVDLAFEKYVIACLEFCAAQTIDGLLYVMYLIIFAIISMSRTRLRHYS